MAKLLIEESTLTAIGDAIRGKTGGTDLISPLDMVTEIEAISGDGDITHIPEEAFHFDGNCGALFSNNKWVWFLDKYKDRIEINATHITDMFVNSDSIETVPNMTYTGTKYSDTKAQMTDGMRAFQFCTKLTDLSNVKFEPLGGDINEANFQDLCKWCYSLRKIPDFSAMPNIFTGNSIYGWTTTFHSCVVLDEVLDLPIANRKSYGQYLFQNLVYGCSRLKNLTFRTDNGTPIVATFSDCVMDMTYYTGYAKQDMDITNVTYNHGIGLDKKVTDDATYQALKNDPDWWTTDVAYSRYNKESALRTIQSLPDTSEYLATLSGKTNTIKFKGAAGEKTDGGAINTLSEEEIAIATAKGWTVTFA